MAVPAAVVANDFLRLAESQGTSLTNMQLQKLVYIAQGYHLAFYDKPLYFENTHAWQWGPVIPRLYKALQKYGSGEVSENIPVDPDGVYPVDSDSQNIINAVWNAYGAYSGMQLSALTHKQNTPWSVTWNKDPFSVISLDEIAKHYRQKVDEN